MKPTNKPIGIQYTFDGRREVLRERPVEKKKPKPIETPSQPSLFAALDATPNPEGWR